MQASEWLQGQMADLRQKIEDSNKALVEYEKTNGIVEVGQGENIVMQKLQLLNGQLVQSEADLIQYQAYMKMLDVNDVSNLPNAGQSGTGLQIILQNYISAKSNLAQNLVIYGKNDPGTKKLQGQVDNLKVQLEATKKQIY